jgi:hypothetical protein
MLNLPTYFYHLAIFYVKTKAPQVVVIQSLHTKKYIAMDKHGHITSKVRARLFASLFHFPMHSTLKLDA